MPAVPSGRRGAVEQGDVMRLADPFDPLVIAPFFRPQGNFQFATIPTQCLGIFLAEGGHAGAKIAAAFQSQGEPAGGVPTDLANRVSPP